MPYPTTVTKTMKPFTYVQATSLQDAVEVLAEHGSAARVLAGGTDLLVALKHRDIEPRYVVSLSRVSGLTEIHVDGRELHIGALATIGMLSENPLIEEHLYSLHEATQGFATPQVCSTATIGGNICRSSPSADTAPSLLSLGASVSLVGTQGERRVLLEDFYVGPGANVLDNEVLTEVVVPIPSAPYGTASAKLTRNSCDLAKVNGAVRVIVDEGRLSDVRIAVGAVAPTPIRIPAAEQEMDGLLATDLNESCLDSVAGLVAKAVAPISDSRSTADYRRSAAGVLIQRLIASAVVRVSGTLR